MPCEAVLPPPLRARCHGRPPQVGSTACVAFSYVFPGLLVLRKDPGLLRRGAAGGMLVLGGSMAVLSVYNNLRGQGGL